MQHHVKDWWNSLSSQKKNNIKKWGSASCVGLVILSAYYATGQDKHYEQVEPSERKIEVGANMLEDDIRANVKEQVGSVRSAVDKQNEKIEALTDILEELAKNTQNFERQVENHVEPPFQQDAHDYVQPSYPTPPPMPEASGYYESQSLDSRQYEPMEPRVLGGIGRAEGAPIKKEQSAKKKNLIPLPPSFMAATLLTGVDAMTTELAKDNPEAIFFRIQAPAVLPNSVKANLQGCVVIGNASGNLAKERVQVKLISLNCMAINGKAVIDQRIKGFVADKDGKRDMSGIVITKAGSVIARSFIAAMVGGLGDSVALSNTTTTSSPLGSTQIIDPNKAVQVGLGQGIKAGSYEIQKIYLDLARQAMPVIEVGASKEVTVVIQESVDLEIKEYGDEND